MSSDAELIARIVQDTNRYLDHQQRMHLLWADVERHLAASHIAEHLGDRSIMRRHLQAVSRLLLEIDRHSPRSRQPRQKTPRPTWGPTRHYRVRHLPDGTLG